MGPKYAGSITLSNVAEYATFMTGLWTPRCGDGTLRGRGPWQSYAPDFLEIQPHSRQKAVTSAGRGAQARNALDQ
jgi:hypothetical protein